ncbi:hypothetical protein AB7849_19315 [Rhodanobacter sp. 115]|uniref:hypothetical protein n=1 Tax=Rhodanobacter sp. FW021-MT20 TaxID=1162282 RepID=UPI0034E569D9
MPDMGSLVRNYQHLFPHFAHSWVTLVGLAILIYASLLATLWLVCRLRGRPGVFRDCAMLVLVSIPLAIIPPAALALMGLALFLAVFGSVGHGRGTK